MIQIWLPLVQILVSDGSYIEHPLWLINKSFHVCQCFYTNNQSVANYKSHSKTFIRDLAVVHSGALKVILIGELISGVWNRLSPIG